MTISERVDMEERVANIDIHDTGPGIPMYVIDKIFDPFFTTKAEGTGLGLSVCQRIIHDIGGISGFPRKATAPHLPSASLFNKMQRPLRPSILLPSVV
ncbi:hypothetical protein LJK88_48695 [Paenibacillus sp. P26]|nr:hypothetical protein LJK88_48695 [Paenibacillus sp. P26]